MCTTVRLGDTYVAALQHDLVALPDDATLVGVVRRPTGWFRAAVDENHPALGPPPSLLDEFKRRHETLKARGVCDEEAHNAAWEELGFSDRYLAHLQESDDAQRAVEELLDRIQSGEKLVLVCYENTDQKQCHRTLLREHVEDRLDA